MAIATKTLSINPAFLQEIKDDHHELRQLLHHTSAMFNRPRWMSIEYDRLVDLITKLRDQLAIHFSLEEAYGYCEDAISVAPHLSRRAEALRGQHFELFRQMCRLVEQSEQLLYHEAAPAAAAGLADGFREFASELQLHESRENELILEAFDEDLGAGD